MRHMVQECGFCNIRTLSLLYGFFGGGDMNGISLLCPEPVARVAFLILLAVNAFVFFKQVLPVYKKSFEE